MTVYSQLISTILRDYGDNWFSPRELAKKHNWNYHSIRKYLMELADTGYLESKKVGKFVYYRLKNPNKLSEKEQELAQKESLRWFSQQFKLLGENFRQIRLSLEAEVERLKEKNEELKAENRKLKLENKHLRAQISNLQRLLAETPEEPIITYNKEKPKSRIELIVDLMHQKLCQSDLIRVKPKPEPEL